MVGAGRSPPVGLGPGSAEPEHAGDRGLEFVVAAALIAAAAAVSNLVIGSVAAQAAWEGQDEAAARRATRDHLRANSDRYPTPGALPGTRTDSWPDQFERAMDALLRGLAAHLTERK